MTDLSFSVVSHGQGSMVNDLLRDIESYAPELDIHLTSNIDEKTVIDAGGLCQVRYYNNVTPKGFGANHNQAFQNTRTQFFCVSNPDVRLTNNPFSELVSCMNDPEVGLVAPRILDPTGCQEDSARYFPTPSNLAAKALHLHKGQYQIRGDAPAAVEWVAGMFLLFRAEAFRDVGGFDERFFLYYEDVDICARLWSAGWKVMLHPAVSLVHAAQRTSRKNPRYMAWHFSSMARYFIKHFGRLPHIE